jgi:hypothetical protein
MRFAVPNLYETRKRTASRECGDLYANPAILKASTDPARIRTNKNSLYYSARNLSHC